MIDQKRLIRRLRKGDYKALETVYEHYKDYMLTVAMCLVRNRAVAEDCLHDVFVKLAADLGRFRLNIRTNLRAYLSTAVANRCRDILKRKDSGNVSINDCPNMADVSSMPGIPGMSDNMVAAQPVDIAIRKELTHNVYKALCSLPFPQREVVTLYHLSSMKFRQIADLQGVSVNSVRSRYRYGLNKLRLLLDKEDE